jgi:transposase-like protein
MLCPKCQGEDCIHIEITLSGEDQVQFYSCRLCESKWWERDGDTVALDEVLTLAAESQVK